MQSINASRRLSFSLAVAALVLTPPQHIHGQGVTTPGLGASSSPFPLLSYGTLGAATGIPTNNTSEELLLGVAYSGTGTVGTTDHVTLLSVTPEFIQ
jgi:hypothetical protein